MASISVDTFEIARTTRGGDWFIAPLQKSTRIRYFELTSRTHCKQEYMLYVMEDGRWEVLQHSRDKPPLGQHWPYARRKVAFAILLAVWKEIGNPWAP